MNITDSSKYHKEYRERNKEKIAEYQKEYRERNKEKIAEYYKEYRERNKEILNQKARDKRKQRRNITTTFLKNEKLDEILKDINNIIRLLRKPKDKDLNILQQRDIKREYKRQWRLRNLDKERSRDKARYLKKASTPEGRAEMKEKERIKWQRRKERLSKQKLLNSD